jgi:hypothetical protein
VIRIDCEQGSEEWVRARLGIPTASRFDQILTAKTHKPAAARFKYMDELLAEWVLGEPLDQGGSAFMERGTEMETEARDWYAFQSKDGEVVQVGFVLKAFDGDGPHPMIGCSPDALVGDDGLLEIKCLGAKAHVAALLGRVSNEYNLQTQGQIYVTERKWCDRLFYNPVLPNLLTRVEPDGEVQMLLGDALLDFTEMMERGRQQLIQLGAQPAAVREVEDAEAREAKEVEMFKRLVGD